MTEPLIYSVGTQVVVQKETYHVNRRVAHPAGSVGVIVRSPIDRTHAYRVKFNDGFEAAVHHDQLIRLSEFKRDHIRGNDESSMIDLNERVIYRCVIGSRAYGLEDDQSDTDRRGIYLPPAELHWSLYGVPEQLENEETQEAYWEVQKFIVLALKANPNVLECHLIRLLISGIDVLREGKVTVEVDPQREQLLEIRRGEVPFAEADAWRKRLQVEFEQAFQQTTLPDRPDYERVNSFLIHARKLALQKELP